jgi:transcriptional regulator with XRE-family HTH domain
MEIHNELSDDAALTEIGRRLARWRLDRNLTQGQLAAEAGVSRDTVQSLERGHNVTVVGLFRVLRALGLLDGLEQLVPEPLPSPIEQLQRTERRRQRAAGAHARGGERQPGPWTWGTP